MQKLILYILTVFALIGTFSYLYFNQQQQAYEENEVLNKRSFFKKWGKKAHENKNKLTTVEDDYPEIVTYGINILINTGSSNGEEDQLSHSQDTSLTAQCDVQTIYDEELNVYDIAVSYSMVIKHDIVEEGEELEKDINVEENDESYFEEEQYFLDGEEYEEPIQDLDNQFFLLQVDADSGEILELYVETFNDENEIITQTTQQLINDIFPELRQKSYSKGNIEEDNLGLAKVDYIQEEVSENVIAITKEYNSDDYISFTEPEIKYPETEFERVVLVDVETGLVNEGETDFKFILETEIDEEKLKDSQNSADGENVHDVFGQIMGEVKANFWIINPTDNDKEIAKDMFRYRNEAIFESKKLNKNVKASIVYGSDKPQQFEFVDVTEKDEIEYVDDSELENSSQSDLIIRFKNSDTDAIINDDDEENNLKQSNLQSYGRPILRESRVLSTVNILKQKIDLQVRYIMYDYITVMVFEFVINNKHTVEVMIQEFDNCKQHNEQNIITENYEFFYAEYPVYAGITIPVQAMGRISYGYKVKALRDQDKACSLIIEPIFKASLYGDGQIAVANVVSAGVYAEGFFLDSSLTFKLSTKRNLSYAQLTASFRSYKIDMGIVYQTIECSLKNALKQEQPRLSQNEEKLQFIKKSFKKVTKKVTKTVKKTAQKAKDFSQKVANKAVDHVKNQLENQYKNAKNITYGQIQYVTNISKIGYNLIQNPADFKSYKEVLDFTMNAAKMQDRIIKTIIDETKICKIVEGQKTLYSKQDKAYKQTLFYREVKNGI